jgi:DNA-binding winged helix-turn-helix (wHTH) protein/tetratricopeptide (TPR) repeat protein
MAGTSSVVEISFGPFRLDASNARLLRDGTPVALTPKAFDVLHHLASRPERLVTKDELLSAVWPDVIVSDASVKVCVREIRKALDDGAKTPTYVETVHRRGYRFIATVREAAAVPAAPAAPTVAPAPVATPAVPAAPLLPFVGRDEELRRLDACFRAAQSGRPQCVFISGGPGSGKTTLAEAFVARVPGAVVLAGHCFQQFGTSEPYMPVWEALGRLAPQRRPPALEALLSRHAAAHHTPEPAAELTGHGPNTLLPRAASERLLRELADGLEALAADAPLVLLLEDLHWADYSTIDLLSALARRRGPAKLMVVATYRPAEILAAEHPLRGVVQGLLTACLAQELALDFLDGTAVAEYVTARFPGGSLPAALPRRLHQRTDGHPLFLVHVVDDLVAQGVLVDHGGAWQLAGAPALADDRTMEGDESSAWLAVLETQIPQTVRAMIELHLERLDRPARHALEAAAVAGMEFSAAAVAAALEMDVVQAEQACDELARRHRFLEPRGLAEWPDGAAATHYRFVHELYHNVVYEQIPVARRVRLHQSIGLRLESAWGRRSPEEAANLAMHFENGRDWPRAVGYLRHAAHAANRHYAHREAAHYLSRALAALDRLPEAQRAAHELDVLQRLGVNLQVTRGFAAHEVEAIHARAYALFRGDGAEPGAPGRDLDVATTFPVLWGIWVFHKVRSDLHRAREMSAGLLRMAHASGDTGLLLQAHQAMCVTHLCLGVPGVCRDHMEQAAAVYDPALHARNTEAYGQDPGVATQAFGSVALWILGRPREALAACERSLDMARQVDQPSSTAVATHFAAMLHQLRGDAARVADLARHAVELSAEEGFSFWHAGGQVLRGWARVATATASSGPAASAAASAASESDAGLADLRRGLDAWLATGSRTYHTYYLGLLADALHRIGRPREALRPLDEALSAAQLLPEGLYEAELYRLRGRSVIGTTADPAHADAHDCFVKALSIARGQGAGWFELRAATDLAALLRRRGQAAEADELLASTAGQFDGVSNWHDPAADLCKVAGD